ncbi:MAG: GNAT family N-acetyltransferase [Marinibacterium sp.]
MLGSHVVSARAGPPGDPIGMAQILVRRWPVFGDFALLARGPVWTGSIRHDAAAEATAALVAALRRRFTGVIATADRLVGRDPLASAGLLPLLTPGSRANLDLGPPAARLSAMHGKWRNRLRRAQAGPLKVRAEPLPTTADHWLLQAETAQSRHRGYRRLPPEFTVAWIAANGPASARLFVARLNGQRVAAMLFLLHGGAASYHIGWSGADGRAHHAHNLLLWEAGNQLSAHGCRCLDLGTIDTETAPGLARFKLGAGAAPMPLGATWLDAPGSRGVARLARPMPWKAGGISGPAAA